MKVHWIPFQEVPQLSYKDVSYTQEIAELAPFYKYPVTIDAFKAVIADKAKATIERGTLVEVLAEQYAPLAANTKVLENIQLLSNEKTFTLITAHQPSLFTGPLYYIYKIISCIHLSRQLKEAYPDYHFVPFFVTGGEDHDFEEVNYVNLFNKKLVWENEEKGSVGMMSTKNIRPTLAQLKDLLGSSEKYGLVVLNMNHPKLKRQFIPYIKEEILQRPSQALVAQTSQQLATVANFKQQAFPRPINFFYLRKNLRERIVFEEGIYQVLNSDYRFTEAEIVAEIETHPEYFSPNVVMRPLYQEVVMPNLAYIGGGGELAYWLERKAQFEHFKVNFPMLIRRNSVMWLDKGTAKKVKKLGFSASQIFEDGDAVIRLFLENSTSVSLEIKEEKTAVANAFEQIAAKAKKIDPTLAKTILAEKSKQLKVLGQLEGRLLRAEKQKHEVSLQQINGLKTKLFPKNGLQERYDNFLSLYVKYGRSFFDILLEHLDPLKKHYVATKHKLLSLVLWMIAFF